MSVLLKGGAGLSVSVKPFAGLCVSVRPVAVFRCEFERAPEFFMLVSRVSARRALAHNCISWSGLPSTCGGSLSTFEAKFTLLGNGLDRPGRAGRLAHSLSL